MLGAQALPVIAVPELPHVAFVGLDVVDIGGFFSHIEFGAFDAPGVFLEEPGARFVPGGCVASLAGR